MSLALALVLAVGLTTAAWLLVLAGGVLAPPELQRVALQGRSDAASLSQRLAPHLGLLLALCAALAWALVGVGFGLVRVLPR